MIKKIAYIGLGSNLNQPFQQIKNALQALNILESITVKADSGFYTSKPMGPENQPDYVNAVVEIETSMSAVDLLKQCQLIESQQGRIKTRHWGERSIDLDILLFSNEEIKTKKLNVPHPGICLRDFVYLPLLKVNPGIIVPGKGCLKDIVQSMNAEFDCCFSGNIE